MHINNYKYIFHTLYIYIYICTRFRVKLSPSVASVPSNLSGDCNSSAAGIGNFAFRDLQFDLWTQYSDLLLLLTLIFGLILFLSGVPEPQNTRVFEQHPWPFLNWYNPGICLWISTFLCLTWPSGLHSCKLSHLPCVFVRVRALHGHFVLLCLCDPHLFDQFCAHCGQDLLQPRL